MTSAGGLVPVGAAAAMPARLLLSGPAGGVRAGAEIAAANGFADAITFDMGGTSTDVCLVLGRSARAGGRAHGERLPDPPAVPRRPHHRRRRRLDRPARPGRRAGGRARSRPAPCPGRPATAWVAPSRRSPTPTSSPAACPRDASSPASAGCALDDAQRRARPGRGHRRGRDRGGGGGDGAGAAHRSSVARGVDPRRLALVAFGGAGPHARLRPGRRARHGGGDHPAPGRRALGGGAAVRAAPARPRAFVAHADGPRRASPRRWPSWPRRARRRSVVTGPELETAVDCRYAGQSHEITVPTVDAFADEHWRRNGYDRPDTAIEVVALRATARRPAPLAVTDLPDARSDPAGRCRADRAGRAGLHGLGACGAGGPNRARPARSCCGGSADGEPSIPASSRC